MVLRTLTPEQRAAGNALYTKKMRGSEPEPPEYRNVQITSEMFENATFPYGGIRYVVPPVPVPEGLVISKLLVAWRKLDGDESEEARRLAAEIFKIGIRLAKQLLFPSYLANRHGLLRGWRRVWWMQIMKNPFRAMSEREFVGMLYFLAMCRMKTRQGN